MDQLYDRIWRCIHELDSADPDGQGRRRGLTSGGQRRLCILMGRPCPTGK